MQNKRRKRTAGGQEPSDVLGTAEEVMQTITDFALPSEFHDADTEFRKFEEGHQDCLPLKPCRNAVPRLGECMFFARDGSDAASREADYVRCSPPSLESGSIRYKGLGQAFERQNRPLEGIWSGNGRLPKADEGELAGARRIRYFCRIALPGHEQGPQPSSPKQGRRLQEGKDFNFLEPKGERLFIVRCTLNNQTQMITDALREYGSDITEHRHLHQEHEEQLDDLFTRVGDLELRSIPERFTRHEGDWTCQNVLEFFPLRRNLGGREVTIRWSGAIEHFREYVKGKGCKLWRELFKFGKLCIPSERNPPDEGDPLIDTGWRFLPTEITEADVRRHWGDVTAKDLKERDPEIEKSNWKRTMFCSLAVMMLAMEGYLPGEAVGHPTMEACPSNVAGSSSNAAGASSNAAGASSSTDDAEVFSAERS